MLRWKKILRILCWILILQPFLFYTISVLFNVELKDERLSEFYNSFSYIAVFCVVVFLTILSISKENSKKVKFGLIFLSPLFGISALGALFFLNIAFWGFGVWTDFTLIAISKSYSKTELIEQRLDVGALGYSGQRTIERTTYGIWQRNKVVAIKDINWSHYNKMEKDLMAFP